MFMQDTELSDLRETIEALKAKNDEAQAVIHGALNTPDNMKGLEIYQLTLFPLPLCTSACVSMLTYSILRSRYANSTSELV